MLSTRVSPTTTNPKPERLPTQSSTVILSAFSENKLATTSDSKSTVDMEPTLPISYRIKWAVEAYNFIRGKALLDGCPGTILDAHDVSQISEENLYSETVINCCYRTLSAPFASIGGTLMCPYTFIGASVIWCKSTPGDPRNSPESARKEFSYVMSRTTNLMLSGPFFKTACQTIMCCCGYCAGAAKDACCNTVEKPVSPEIKR